MIGDCPLVVHAFNGHGRAIRRNPQLQSHEREATGTPSRHCVDTLPTPSPHPVDITETETRDGDGDQDRDKTERGEFERGEQMAHEERKIEKGEKPSLRDKR
jgi:hypothetical protein